VVAAVEEAVLLDAGVAAGSTMTVRVVFDPVGDSAESGEAGLVGNDVGDGVGRGLRGVDFNGGRCGAVEEGLDAEVAVLLRPGDLRAEVAVGGAGRGDRSIVTGAGSAMVAPTAIVCFQL
jgi:hypothetical protein